MALSKDIETTVFEMGERDRYVYMAGLSFGNLVDFSVDESSADMALGVVDTTTEEMVHFSRTLAPGSDSGIEEAHTRTWTDYRKAFSVRYLSHEYRTKLEFFFRKSRIMSRLGMGVEFDSIETPAHFGGKDIIVRFTYLLERSPQTGRLMATFVILNITDIRKATNVFAESSQRDGLTGLLNRETAAGIIDDHITFQAGSPALLAVVDIDSFSPINARFGHQLGDELLLNFAEDLTSFFGDDVIISRTGSDDFLLFFPDTPLDQAERMIMEFSMNGHFGFMHEDGGSQVFYCSIGYSIYPEQGTTYDELTTQANDALHAAKASDVSHMMRYDDSMKRGKGSENLGFSLRDIANCMPSAMFVYHADGDETILFANKELIDLFECDSFDDFMDHTKGSFRTLVHPDDIDRVEGEIWKQIPMFDSIDFCCYRIVTKTGKIKNVEDYGRLVHSREFGNVFYVAIHDLDLRDRLVAVQG